MSTQLSQYPPSESHPPRSSLWTISLILVVAGVLISGYLSYAKLTSQSVICLTDTATFDCQAVETSQWAVLLGVPVAYLGLLAHLTLGAILLSERRFAIMREYGPMLMFGIALVGFAYHSFLTYQSIFGIGKLCPWCLAAHAVMMLQLIVTGLRLRQSWMTTPVEA